MKRDQQQHPLLPHALDITIESPGGHWSGKTIDLNPSWAKVTLAGNSVPLPLKTIVQLRIAMPDGDPPLSLPARVMETDPNGVSLSLFNLKEQQVQRLKDHLAALFLQGSKGSPRQSGADRSLNSEAEALPQSLGSPESVEDARPAERGAELHGAAEGNPEAAEELELAEPKEQSVPLKVASPEEAKWEELLGRVGLEILSLPHNGLLSRQWVDFLEQLEATKGRTEKTNSGKIARPYSEQPRRARRKEK